jgi:hypothetical protein
MQWQQHCLGRTSTKRQAATFRRTAKPAHHVDHALAADELKDAVAGNDQECVVAAQVAELQLWFGKYADALSSCIFNTTNIHSTQQGVQAMSCCAIG